MNEEEKHNVFEHSEEEARQWHPSNGDHISVWGNPTSNGSTPTSNEINKELVSAFKESEERFKEISKRYMNAFLYLEETSREAAQLCQDIAEALKTTFNTEGDK